MPILTVKLQWLYNFRFVQNKFSYDGQYAEKLSEQEIYLLMESPLRHGCCCFVCGQ